MPNYSIVANSTFQPFTYQELMAPVQRMSDVHDLVAAQYDALSSQADILEAMGANDVDRDSKAYSQYKAYSDSLRNEADALNKYGLQLDSKGRMLGLRSRYNKEIQPIKTAYEKRTAEAKEQQDAWIKNPSLMFTRTAAQTSIDDYVANPNGGYGVINGALITQQMSEMASQLAKQVREGKITRNDIDPYTYDLITKTGLDENDINMWLANPNSYPTLYNMMNQVLQSNGVTAEALQGSRNAQDIISKSINYAQMGAWSAIGEDKHNIQANFGSRLSAEESSAIRRHAAQKAIDAAYSGGSGGDGSGSEGFNDSIYQLPMAAATKDSPATSMNVRALNYEKADWNPNSRNYMVREIKSYKDGKPVFDTKSVSLGELLNRQDSNKKDINVSSYWSDINGQEGLVLATTEDGKAHRYFIDANSMPESNITTARQYFNMARQYRENGEIAEANQATQIALRALHTGLTTHNKSYEQSLVRQPSLKQQGLTD